MDQTGMQQDIELDDWLLPDDGTMELANDDLLDDEPESAAPQRLPMAVWVSSAATAVGLLAVVAIVLL